MKRIIILLILALTVTGSFISSYASDGSDTFLRFQANAAGKFITTTSDGFEVLELIPAFDRLFASVGQQQRHFLFPENPVRAQVDQRRIRAFGFPEAFLHQRLKRFHRSRPVHLPGDYGVLSQKVLQQRRHCLHVIGSRRFRGRHRHKPVAPDQEAPRPSFSGAAFHSQ